MKMMRLFSHFSTILSVIALGLIGSTVSCSKASQDSASEADFLNKVHEKANTVAKSEGEGLLPPTGETALVPQIVLDPPDGVLDVGVIANDKKASKQFKVYNKGRANLTISRVTTNCACTMGSVEPAEEVVRPGGSSIVHVTIDPARIPGFQARKTLTVFSDDPSKQAVNMDVISHVDPEFVIEPESINYGEFKKGDPVEKAVVIRYLTDPPKGELIIESHEDFTVEKTLRPQNEWKAPNRPEYLVKVRANPTIPPGDIKFWLFMRNACQRIARFPIPVEGKSLSFFTIEPMNRKVLLRSEVSTEMKSSPHLTLESQKPFEITDIMCSDPGLAYEVKPGKDPNTKLLEFSLKPNASKATRLLTVQYKVKSGDETAIERATVRIIGGLPGQRNPESGEASSEEPETPPDVGPQVP